MAVNVRFGLTLGIALGVVSWRRPSKQWIRRR